MLFFQLEFNTVPNSQRKIAPNERADDCWQANHMATCWLCAGLAPTPIVAVGWVFLDGAAQPDARISALIDREVNAPKLPDQVSFQRFFRTIASGSTAAISIKFRNTLCAAP